MPATNAQKRRAAAKANKMRNHEITDTQRTSMAAEAQADEAWVRKRAPGAGRKSLAGPDDPTIEQAVTMPASLWAKARELGGTASAGIRLALNAKKMPSREK